MQNMAIAMPAAPPACSFAAAAAAPPCSEAFVVASDPWLMCCPPWSAGLHWARTHHSPIYVSRAYQNDSAAPSRASPPVLSGVSYALGGLQVQSAHVSQRVLDRRSRRAR